MTIREALKHIAVGDSTEGLILVGKVTAVEGDTIDVSPADGRAAVLGLRIQAAQGAATGVKLEVKEGSDVVIGLLNSTLGVLLAASEIAAMEVIADKVVLGEDGEKAVLGESLNGQLGDIIGIQEKVVIALQTFATAQAAASVGPLLGYAAGFTALGTALAPLAAEMAAIRAKLPNHLAQKVTLK